MLKLTALWAGIPLTPPPPEIVSFRNKLVSRVDFWAMWHMPGKPELAFRDYTGNRPQFSLTEKSLI